jgi:type I restriction-modification system DNA methylase subunit
MSKLVKSKKRVKEFGEVFTPKELVLEMLAKIPEETWLDSQKTWLDPACGDGNFLVEVVDIRINKYKQDPLQVLSTVYGIDIQEDNVLACRKRLLIAANLVSPEAQATVESNIITANTLEMHKSVNKSRF